LNLLFVVVNININYRKPLVPNILVEISVNSIEYFNSKIVFKQEVVDAATGVLCNTADVTFVLLDKESGKPTPISKEIKRKFDELQSE
jgi:thioesterase-3